jgi:pre-rRNA-processing protein TSR4
MAPKVDDWSDSDDDGPPEVESSVLLGVPDGPVDDAADINDAAVSRIGGHPVRCICICLCMPYSLTRLLCKAFLPFEEPLLSSSTCKNCSNSMELLVQMWCPFEDSPHDRALYIWGCAKGSCQKKDGR